MTRTSSKAAAPVTYRYAVLYKESKGDSSKKLYGTLAFVETNPASRTVPVSVTLTSTNTGAVVHRGEIKNASEALSYVGEMISVGAYQIDILSEVEIRRNRKK